MGICPGIKVPRPRGTTFCVWIDKSSIGLRICFTRISIEGAFRVVGGLYGIDAGRERSSRLIITGNRKRDWTRPRSWREAGNRAYHQHTEHQAEDFCYRFVFFIEVSLLIISIFVFIRLAKHAKRAQNHPLCPREHSSFSCVVHVPIGTALHSIRRFWSVHYTYVFIRTDADYRHEKHSLSPVFPEQV